MARVFFIISTIYYITITTCEETTDGGIIDSSTDKVTNLFDEVGKIDDEQLWNLLKEASRNSTNSLSDVAYDYADYEDLGENEATEKTESNTFVDQYSNADDGISSSVTEQTSEDPSYTSEESSTTSYAISSTAEVQQPESSVPTQSEEATTVDIYVTESTADVSVNKEFTDPVFTTFSNTASSLISSDFTETPSANTSDSYVTDSTAEDNASTLSINENVTFDSTEYSEPSSSRQSEPNYQSTTSLKVSYNTESSKTYEGASTKRDFLSTPSTPSDITTVINTENIPTNTDKLSSSEASPYHAKEEDTTMYSPDESISPIITTSTLRDQQTITPLASTPATANHNNVTITSTHSVTKIFTKTSTLPTSTEKLNSVREEDQDMSSSPSPVDITGTSDKIELVLTSTILTPSVDVSTIAFTPPSDPTTPSTDRSKDQLVSSTSKSPIETTVTSEKPDSSSIAAILTPAVGVSTNASTSTSDPTTQSTDRSEDQLLSSTSKSPIDTTVTSYKPDSSSTTAILTPAVDISTNASTATSGPTTLSTDRSEDQLVSSTSKSPIETTVTPEKPELGTTITNLTPSMVTSTNASTLTPEITTSHKFETVTVLTIPSTTLRKGVFPTIVPSPTPIIKETDIEKTTISITTQSSPYPSTTKIESLEATSTPQQILTSTKNKESRSSTTIKERPSSEEKLTTSLPVITSVKPKVQMLTKSTTLPKDSTTSALPSTTFTPTTAPKLSTSARTPPISTLSSNETTIPQEEKPIFSTALPAIAVTTPKVTTKVIPTLRQTPGTTTTLPKEITSKLLRNATSNNITPFTVTTTPRTVKPKNMSKKKPPTSRVKTTPRVEVTTPPTTKPKPTRTNTVPTTFQIQKNLTERPSTIRPKVNKFDPKKISIIGEDTEKSIIPAATKSPCKIQQCSTTQKSKVHVFDSKKIFMIDQATEPPVILKHKFDPSRKFVISEPVDDKSKASPENKNITEQKPSLNFQPMPRPAIHMFSISNEGNTDRTEPKNEDMGGGEVMTHIGQNQGFIKTDKSVPEVVCFAGGQLGGKPVLKCVAVNPLTRAHSAPFHVNIRPRLQYSISEPETPPVRKIFIRNRIYQGPAVVVRQEFPMNRDNYAITGNIFNSPRDGRHFKIPTSFKLSLNTPTRHLHITNNQPPSTSQHFAVQPASSNGNRKIYFQLSPPVPIQAINSEYFPGRMSQTPDQTNYRVLIRHPRSARRCNADNTIYEDEGRTLAFVFDDTGSMHDELEQMRATAMEITTQMTGMKRNLIKDYALVTFNDPGVSEPFCTTDYTEFLGRLQQITIQGGGDCPEMCLTGLQKALTVSRPRSFIFVITDADAKDYYLEENILKLIMRKEPFVFFLLTGKCASEDPEGAAVYRNISSVSSGQIIDMGKMGVKEILDELNDKYVRQDLVTLTKINRGPAVVPYSVDVPVDSTLKEITFSISGFKPKLDVTDPKGDNPPGEKKDFPNFKLIKYQNPIAGVWKAVVGSSTTHSFSSIGISNTNFKVGFSVLPPKKVSETSHRPLKGGDNYILVEVSSPEAVEDIQSIELVSMFGKSLNKINLKKIPNSNETLYVGGPFIPPDDLFNMEMHGVGKGGVPIKRISPSAISAQLPEVPYITMLSHVEVEAGRTYIIKCHVESLVPVTVKMFKRTPSSKAITYNFKQTGDALLELKNISLIERGTYICWAKNIAGIEQKDIDITVTVKPPKVFVKEEILFTLDQRIEIQCNVYSPVPYTVLWKRGSGRDFYFVQNNSRTHYTDNRLIIERAVETDQGWYQCLAKNTGGESVGLSYLKMSLLPTVEISPSQKYQAGFNVTLTCSTNGVPSPEVLWHRKGVQLSTSMRERIIVTYFTMYAEINIINAEQGDEGTYTCIANNFAGEVRKDTTLIYEEKPKVITNIIQAEVKAGEDISLSCQVTGIPPPEVEWTKDSLPVSLENLSNTMILSDNSLLIRQSTLTNSGIYKCSARNEVGFDEISIPILVRGTRPQITEPPEDIDIEIGDTGRLECIATGQPLPKVSWTRSNKKTIHGVQDENFLEIFNASLSDKGEYWCIAENSIGRAEAQAFVNITGGVKPIISKVKDIQVIKFLVGDKAELDCVIIGGNPRPDIEWFKDGNKLFRHLSNGIKLENGSYFISNVNPTDVGLYECIATNDLGKDTKRMELKLLEPPKIDMNSSSNVIVTVGSNARLICPVTGDPKPKVSWRRYAHSSHKVMRGEILDESNDLVFENVSEEDTGRYICTAENVAGTARRPFALNVMVPPKINPWPVEMLVESGNIFTLECRVRAIPRPFIFWLKDSESIPRSKYYGQFLRFYTKPEDSGTYTCIAENRAGKDQVETNLIVLVPPQIKEGPSTVKVISGKNAILPCEVSGNPQPFVAWQLNGELIKKEFGSDSGTLHLHNVTEADAGTYICTAQNKAGTNKRKLELIVLTPPKVLPWTAPLKVILGELVNVTCQHFANPEAKIYWYKDKKPLDLELVKDMNRIEFFVEPHHKGVYTCEAVNEAGTDSKDFLLVILDPPSFAQHLPFSVDVIRGKTIEVPCIAFGDPKPIMGWNRTDIILESNSKRIVNSESGLLTIVNASPEDEGYYNCTARNKAGTIWRTVEINVLELPTANLTVSNSIIKEGDVAEFTCHVKGKPLPNIYWKKDGKILSTENDKNLRLIAYYKDSGNYTCVVKNSAGEDFSTVQLNVSVLPMIHGPNEETIVVLEGDEILLNCSGEGFPPPQISWLFNATYKENPLIREMPLGPILRTKKAKKESDGIYKCTGKNFAGSVDKIFRVYVHVKPSIIDHFDRHITLLEGKDFSLPCNAEGIPKPTITWMKEAVKLNALNSFVSSPAVYNNILLIFNAQNKSEGNYTCYAENEAGYSTRNYTITVEASKPPIEEGMKSVEIQETGSGILNCDAKPGSVISWLKDNQTLDKIPLERGDDVHFAVDAGGSILKIVDAFSADSGLYACFAVHPEENVTRLFSVSVLARPYFVDQFQSTVFTVRENESLVLDCPAEGSPTPRINWRLAENNLPVSQHTLSGVYIGGNNDNSLFIKSAKPLHSALYVCSAVNKLGEEKKILSVKVIGPPKLYGPELIAFDIISGTELELNCSIDGLPDPIFKWSFSSRTGNDKILKYISKTIRIGNALAEDDGIYTCLASNQFGNASKIFNVSVIEIPRIKRGVNEKIQLAIGEYYNLKCMCNGRKPMEAKWFFNGNQLNSSDAMSVKLVDSNHLEYTYTIVNVTKDSQGTYNCILSNIAGSDQHKFYVEVIAPPKFSKSPKHEKIQLMEGEKIHLECPVESTDEFRIQWKKNGNIIMEFENKTLHIEESTIKDEANYTCIASNFAGWLSSKFEVNVLAEPKIISGSSDIQQKIPLDKKLALNCTVFGNPRPQILWTKNLEQINDVILPQIVFSEEKQILEIDEVDSSDSGKYSCFSSNIAGSTEKHFEVEVVEPPLVEGENTVLEKEVIVDVYRRAVLRCPFSGSPEPSISWFKDTDEINESDSQYRVSLDKRILTISHAEESAAGIYKCVGKNQVGDNNFIFYLHIRIPMQWSHWSGWLECNASCGGGVQIRKRECLGDRNEILSEFIHLYNSSCVGPEVETRVCNNHICPVDGGWGSWGNWGSCSSSCGQGLRRRSRRCNNPLPAHGGVDCAGETYEDEKCEEIPCPVNGNWGEWSDWNECSATCGLSIKMRTRICNNPAPAYGGLPCTGNSRDISLCKNKECPHDGAWSLWSPWSRCSVSCGSGRQHRYRNCHGTDCQGEKYQVKVCRRSPCQSRRYPRHASLRIHGELNNHEIDQNIEADIIQSDNETSIQAVSRNVSSKDTISYLPFLMSPVSWFTAKEDERGENGLSLTRGNFQEKSTYYFSTGEEMDVQSDAQSVSDDEDLQLSIKVQGRAPISPAATIFINPYTEDLIQTDPNHIKSSSAADLEADGSVIPVSWNRSVSFSGNEATRILPVKVLTAKGSKSSFNRESNQLEFTANPAVISSKILRDSCPKGFKYNMESGECSDINECRRRLNDCLPSQICINTLGSYTCECRYGFRKNTNSAGCKDINECLEGLHQCSHKCRNTRGSYQCHCPRHLILAEDMHNCVEVSDYDYSDEGNIDYLLASSSSAVKYQVAASSRQAKTMFATDIQQDEMDRDSILKYSQVKNISCDSGYQQVGNECEDVNECAEDENSCSREQLCMNTPGSFVCIETPCPENFLLSIETRSCLLLCLGEDSVCTDGASLSESLQIITVPVYKGNYTFYPFTNILELSSYDNNDLPLSGSIYEIVQNEAGLPVKIRNDNRIGVLYAVKYFEVTKQEKLVLMSAKYDLNGNKLHSTMFVVIIYNIKSPPV